ncbi:MAG: hypothetical protein HZB92_08785 [Euryarchaeota archaeon]|nr:hypothetical protein [Euryarchaeota archaeon]
MNAKTTKALSILAIGLMIVSLVPAKTAAAAPQDTLILGLQQDCKNLNFFDPKTNDVWKSYMVGWNFETLMAFTPAFNLYPVLATPKATGGLNGADATVDASGLNITIAIRSGVTFTDGSTMNATDVAFTYQTLGWGLYQTTALKPLLNTTQTYTSWNGSTTHVGVVATDSTHVTFYLNGNFAMFWYGTLNIPIIPSHIWKNHLKQLTASELTIFKLSTAEIEFQLDYSFGSSSFSYGSGESIYQATIGTGPWMMSKWTPNSEAQIDVYGSYWGKAEKVNWANKDYPFYPDYLRHIQFKQYGTLDVAILALQKGDIDYIPWNIGASFYNSLKTDPKIGFEISNDQGYFYMAFNMRKEPMANLSFRQAVAYCIDKEYIVNRLLGGYGVKGANPISITNPTYLNDQHPDYIDNLNLDKAKATLDAAGYTDKNSDGWREKPDGSPLKVTMLTPPKDYDPTRADAGIMISKNLKSIGLNVESVPTSFDAIVAAAYVSVDFDIYVLGWSLGAFPETYLRDIFHSESDSKINPAGQNAMGYHNPTVDAKIDAMLTEMNTGARQTLIKEICGILMTELPYDVLYYRQNIEAFRKVSWEGWVSAFGNVYNGFSLNTLHPPGAAQGAAGGGGGGAVTGVSYGTPDHFSFSGNLTLEAAMNLPDYGQAGGSMTGKVLVTEVYQTTTPAFRAVRPCANATVNITSSYGGYFNTTTDASGEATFVTTLPYMKLYDVWFQATASKTGNWANTSGNVKLSFPSFFAQLTLSTTKGVVAPSGATTVKAKVTNYLGQPMPNITVYIDQAKLFGSMDRYNNTTDASGIASFIYTAPNATTMTNQNLYAIIGANISVPNTVIPEIQSASLTIGVENPVYDWTDLDIAKVNDYILEAVDASPAPNSTTIDVKLKDINGTAISGQLVSVNISDPNVLVPNATMLATNASGGAQFTIWTNPAFAGAKAVLVSFNTSKTFGTKDSVALYVRNDPTYNVPTYHVNIMNQPNDRIDNVSGPGNTSTINVKVLDGAGANVSGATVNMAMSNSVLVQADAATKTTNATGDANFTVTCIANGSADLALGFSIANSIGISQGYNLKVNKTVSPIPYSIIDELVYGPAVGGSKYWHNLASTPVVNATVWKWNAGTWTALVAATDYTINLGTGNISYINELATGDSVYAWYNYSTVVTNETVFDTPAGGDQNGALDHTMILDATIYRENNGSATWALLTSPADYTIVPETGAISLTAPTAAGDVIYAYYNYSTPVNNESVFAGPAVGGETGNVGSLDHVPVVNATVTKQNGVARLPMASPADYGLNLTTGALNVVNPLVSGDNIMANYTYNIAHHRLNVTGVTSYYVDSDPWSTTPTTSTITVRLNDTEGHAQAFKTVSAVTTATNIGIEPSNTTDVTGVATFHVTSASDTPGTAFVYFKVENTSGLTNSVAIYNGGPIRGYAADIDFAFISEHLSAGTVNVTVYDETGQPAANTFVNMYIPLTPYGQPANFDNGNWRTLPSTANPDLPTYYGAPELDLSEEYDGFGSWIDEYTDVNGVVSTPISLASFVGDSVIELNVAINSDVPKFATGAINYWSGQGMTDWEEQFWILAPNSLTENISSDFNPSADPVIVDTSIVKRGPVAVLTEATMNLTYLSMANPLGTLNLTYQDANGPLAKKTVLNESLIINAGSGIKTLKTKHHDILDLTLLIQNTSGWTQLTNPVGYSFNDATGAITLVANLTVGDNVYAHYNYTTNIMLSKYTSKPKRLTRMVLPASGVMTYVYNDTAKFAWWTDPEPLTILNYPGASAWTTGIGEQDSVLPFTAILTDRSYPSGYWTDYATFPSTFLFPYIAQGTAGKNILASIGAGTPTRAPVAPCVVAGDNATLTVSLKDEYGLPVSGANVSYEGKVLNSTNASGVSVVSVPTPYPAYVGAYEIQLTIQKGTMASTESYFVNLVDPELFLSVEYYNLNATAPTVNKPFNVTFTALNNWSYHGFAYFDLIVDGAVVNTQRVNLTGMETKNVTFAHTLADTQNHNVTVAQNGRRSLANWTVKAGDAAAANLLYSNLVIPTNITAGTQFTMTVDVQNNGTLNGTFNIPFIIDDIVYNISATINSGQTVTVSMPFTFATSGSHTIRVGSLAQQTVTVNAAATTTAQTGYDLMTLAIVGIVLMVVGLLVGFLIAKSMAKKGEEPEAMPEATPTEQPPEEPKAEEAKPEAPEPEKAEPAKEEEKPQ